MPADLSTFDIERFFTFPEADLAALRSRYKEELRLGAALQVGFLQMTGRALDLLDRVPGPLLTSPNSWRLRLRISQPFVPSTKRRRATLFEHQAWAIEHLGMTRFEKTDIAKLSKPLADLVRAGRSFDQLQWEAKELLYRERLVIPGPQRAAALVQSAVKSVESFHVLRQRVFLGELHDYPKWERYLSTTQYEAFRQAISRGPLPFYSPTKTI